MFTLTDQEYNIVTLVAKGYSAKQIAKKLYITRNTLSGHLQRLYTALNLEGDNRHLIKVVALYHQGKIKPGKRDNTAYTEAVKLIKEGERVTDIARRTGYTTSGISKIKQKITGSRQ